MGVWPHFLAPRCSPHPIRYRAAATDHRPVLALNARPATGQREPLLVRLRVRIRSIELDEQIAAGVDPNTSRELRLRTLQLASSRSRDGLAEGVDRVLEEA